MNQKNNKNQFEAYEYKQIITNENEISFLIDGYKHFGWVVDENMNFNVSNTTVPNTNMVLRLKRNRNLINKMELTRLQRNFEFCVKEIEHLEAAKTSKATMFAIMAGIFGVMCMSGSIYFVKADPHRIVLAVILAFLAIVGIISSYFIYKNVVSKSTEKMSVFIEKKQDEIIEICAKGSKLL